MLIDFTEVLKSLDGRPLKEREDSVTLGIVSTIALLDPIIDARTGQPEHISADEKLRRFMLATKIYGATLPVDLKPEEVTLIRELIGKRHSILVYGQAYEMLDPKPKLAEAAE